MLSRKTRLRHQDHSKIGNRLERLGSVLFDDAGDFCVLEVVELAHAAVDVAEFGGGIAFDDDGVGAFVEEFLEPGLAGEAGEEDDGDVWILGIVAEVMQELLMGAIGGECVQEDHAREGVGVPIRVNTNTAQKEFRLFGASADIEVHAGLAREGVANLENEFQVVNDRHYLKLVFAPHSVFLPAHGSAGGAREKSVAVLIRF